MYLRLFLSLLTAAFVTASAHAQTPKRTELTTQVDTCWAILQEFQANPKTAIPSSLLQQAKAIVIVNEFQMGIGIGGKGGWGVVLNRRPNGGWSVPAFLNAGEVSLGLQLGAKTVRTVYLLMDDAGVRLLYRSRFNFGVDAGAVGGPRAAEVQEATPIIKASVYTYQMRTGLYAGTKLKTGWLSSDNSKNRVYYNTERTMPEILFSDWITPPAEVVDFMNYVRQVAGN